MTQALAHTLLSSDAAVGQWVLDADASTVSIAHKTFWGLATVKGRFASISGQGTISAGGKVSGILSIDTASIDTKSTKRDGHLRSAEFFDVEKYPQIVAEIVSATITPEHDVQLQTELTVKAVREPLQLIAHVSDVNANAVTVTVETTIDRDRFGLSWNQLGMMKRFTTVKITAVFTRAA